MLLVVHPKDVTPKRRIWMWISVDNDISCFRNEFDLVLVRRFFFRKMMLSRTESMWTEIWLALVSGDRRIELISDLLSLAKIPTKILPTFERQLQSLKRCNKSRLGT